MGAQKVSPSKLGRNFAKEEGGRFWGGDRYANFKDFGLG